MPMDCQEFQLADDAGGGAARGRNLIQVHQRRCPDRVEDAVVNPAAELAYSKAAVIRAR